MHITETKAASCDLLLNVATKLKLPDSSGHRAPTIARQILLELEINPEISLETKKEINLLLSDTISLYQGEEIYTYLEKIQHLVNKKPKEDLWIIKDPWKPSFKKAQKAGFNDILLEFAYELHLPDLSIKNNELVEKIISYLKNNQANISQETRNSITQTIAKVKDRFMHKKMQSDLQEIQKLLTPSDDDCYTQIAKAREESNVVILLEEIALTANCPFSNGRSSAELADALIQHLKNKQSTVSQQDKQSLIKPLTAAISSLTNENTRSKLQEIQKLLTPTDDDHYTQVAKAREESNVVILLEEIALTANCPFSNGRSSAELADALIQHLKNKQSTVSQQDKQSLIKPLTAAISSLTNENTRSKLQQIQKLLTPSDDDCYTQIAKAREESNVVILLEDITLTLNLSLRTGQNSAQLADALIQHLKNKQSTVSQQDKQSLIKPLTAVISSLTNENTRSKLQEIQNLLAEKG